MKKYASTILFSLSIILTALCLAFFEIGTIGRILLYVAIVLCVIANLLFTIGLYNKTHKK